MISILFVVGVVTIVIGVIAALISGSLLGFIVSITSMGISSLIYFALAKILENQEDIKGQLRALQDIESLKLEDITCYSCGKTYSEERSSCPYCGRKKDEN